MEAATKSKSIIFAQCDAQISNTLIEKKNRHVQSMVDEVDPDVFQRLLITDTNYSKVFRLLSSCYDEALKAGYFFEHDCFGGYGLFYGQEDSIKITRKRDILLPGLHALLQTVDDKDLPNFTPISIFAGTDICKKSRIMVGPVPFANHSCKPNTEYVASFFKHKNA